MELVVNCCLNMLLCKYLWGRVMFRSMVLLWHKKSRVVLVNWAFLCRFNVSATFLHLPGCHWLPSHLTVAHSLTPSSYDCFLMALPFYFSLFLTLSLTFSFLLSLSCRSSVSHPSILSCNHFNKTANENSREQKRRESSFVPIQWWARRGLHFFFHCSKSFTLPTHFQSKNHLEFA